MSLTVGSLFSGIGGLLDLGLERAGMTVVWQSEIDPYASRVLAKHWPHVPNLGDITAIDWSQVEPVDLICGGYPCQPFSLAGVRRGESDPRHLWPHFHRAIRDLRPRYALLENVPGHLSLGFDRVLGDLAEIGYDLEWCCLPAAAVGAPHLRYRVLALAYPHRESEPGLSINGDERQGVMVQAESLADATGGSQPSLTGLNRQGLEPFGARFRAGRGAFNGHSAARVGVDQRSTTVLAEEDAATHSSGPQVRGPVGSTHDHHHWAVEPDVGRVAHGVPSRVDRLRCLGNAVVPQVAEWIGHQIMAVAA